MQKVQFEVIQCNSLFLCHSKPHLRNIKIRRGKIEERKKSRGTPFSRMIYLAGQRGNLYKLSYGSETLCMTSEGLGELFEGDFADTCAEKIPLVSMGARAEGLACADPGARTPIGASGNY